MPTLAVALIVKNEAQELPFCLNSVKDWVDEMIVLDSGSTDGTQAIAQSYGAKVYSNTHWPGFGKQRQLAQTYIKSDYVLWLDADERVTPELKAQIQAAVASDESHTLYQINRLSEVFGKKIHHSGWYPDYVTRLYRTKDTQYDDSLVHESVVVPAGFKLKKLDGHLLHYTYKTLHQYLNKSASYAQAWAEQRAAKGKKASLWDACSHAFARFIRMYLLKRGFMDGKHGFLLAVLSAHSVFVKYAELWIKTSTKR
ncbi:glycosyltransferase family 2 protein [Pelistega suis]|uniref:Glycosyltransferase family 2 protein n=1 Tax=Pelistega suis TaxID=1631957 RepID=A0A849P0W4_9BURK|nr:glycosyltransferase family 2 protein [Pelistega suis]NOL51379.1 glycosyltransferase family 2 protein [Pelistega suis]